MTCGQEIHKAERGFRPGKNGFAAAVFEVDPEFGFSGRQRRVR